MAEFLNKEQADQDYASKGKGNTALGFGIAGLGAALLGGNGGILGNILGGCNRSTNTEGCGCHSPLDIEIVPSKWDLSQKECADNLALTRGIYDMRIADLNEKFDLYARLNNKITELEKKEVATATSLPLVFELSKVNSERYTDNKVYHEAGERREADFCLQSQLCKKVDGQLGLPFSSIITGIPSLPPVKYVVTGCNGESACS